MQTNKQVEKLVNYIVDKDYGTIIYHQEIANLLGVQYGSHQYSSIVQRAKKKLLEAGKMIDCVRKTGYEIIMPDNYTNCAVKSLSDGAKKIDKGSKIMDSAPVQKMSSAGLESYNLVNDRLHLVRAAIAGAVVEVNMLSQKRQHPLELAK